MGQTEEQKKPEAAPEGAPEETPKTTVGYGFDKEGFFRLVIHESRGICELLGFLEQMKDVVKGYYTHKDMQNQKQKLIVPGINNVLKRFKR